MPRHLLLPCARGVLSDGDYHVSRQLIPIYKWPGTPNVYSRGSREDLLRAPYPGEDLLPCVIYIRRTAYTLQ